MPLIDENGQFLGKINLFDLVILFLILLTIITAGKLLFFNESLKRLVGVPSNMPQCWPGETPYSDQGGIVNLTVTLYLNNQPEWFNKALVIGDSNQEGSRYLFKILDKTSIKLLNTQSLSNYDIKLTLLMRVLKKENDFLYEDQQIKIGGSLSLSLPKINFKGKVLEIIENEN